MPHSLQALAAIVRREILAWLFGGLALRWVWLHGLDRWSVILSVLAMGIHPRRRDP